MEDASAADPERDVVGSFGRAVRDEVPAAEIRFRQLLACLLLLVRVANDEAAAGPKRHVDEAGAVDAGGGHAAPLVARAEQGARVLDGIGGDRPQPPRVALAPELLAPHPAGVRIGGLDANPVAPLLEDAQRLAGQGLRHLLGAFRRRATNCRELAYERMFA